jgi:cardiolipin synthase
MLAAIASVRERIRFESYIFAADGLGEQFRDALAEAARRGVKVNVLLDAFGSQSVPTNFWAPLAAAGGEARYFNPVLLKRFGFRDHRKLLVCDDHTAFVGGFNISSVYQGDGVNSGWRDLGLRLEGHFAAALDAAFDEMFARAEVQHKPFTRLRRSSSRKAVRLPEGRLLLTGPGRGRNPFERELHQDFARARHVRIIAAYFLPSWRIRRELARVVRRGGRVQLILAGKSDVYLSQLAARSLYRRLLRAGVEIHEYQPQILHAKLIIVDHAVYVGSSNLDTRSLRINYELMFRFTNRELVAGARGIFEECLTRSESIDYKAWCRSRTWWRRLRYRWAYFLLARVDPYLARWQHKNAPD